MEQLSAYDWEIDIENFKKKIDHFLRWFLTDLNENKLIELCESITGLSHNDIPNMEILKAKLETHSVLKFAKTGLFFELGSGQYHRRTMAQILDVKILEAISNANDLLDK